MKIDFVSHTKLDNFNRFNESNRCKEIADILDNADYLIFKLYYDGCIGLFAAKKAEKRIDGCISFYIGDVQAETSTVISQSKTAHAWLVCHSYSHVCLEGFLPAKELDAFKEELFMELMLSGITMTENAKKRLFS